MPGHCIGQFHRKHNPFKCRGKDGTLLSVTAMLYGMSYLDLSLSVPLITMLKHFCPLMHRLSVPLGVHSGG